MEEPLHHGSQMRSPPPSTATPIDASTTSTSQVEEEEDHQQSRNEGNLTTTHSHNHQPQHHQRQSSSTEYFRINISISDLAATRIRDDVLSCLLVVVSFWFFVWMTMVLGFYGPVNLTLGPYCSRRIQTSPLFVQSIEAKAIDELKPGLMLYGFYEPPPLDVEITWNETHTAFVPIDFHKEWVYYLNKGSKLDIHYNVKSPSFSLLSLVIAQGRENLVEWVEDPSYPNTTLLWKIIYGSGEIQQEILKSSNYYIAVGNLNSEEVEVELKLTVKAIIYNTTQAYYMCSLSNHLCSLKLFLLGTSVAVLTSPGPAMGASDDTDWYVKLSYGPRWISYFVGSGMMTVFILLVFRLCNMFETSREEGEGERTSERAPLLSHKDDDISSWDSSYDSISHDEADLDEWFAVNSLGGKAVSEGELHRRLCAICFDAPRDCFFLPCGHCAACFTCGTRIAEAAGVCPICRRNMKKVRKIFTV